MNQRESLDNASNFWSNSFFKNLGCCGCGDRDQKVPKDDLSPNDQSWMTEYYYELPVDQPLDQPILSGSRPEKQRQGRQQRSPRNITGKGASYREGDEPMEDEARSTSSKISRKKISKNKESTSRETSKSKSTSKGRNPWQPEEDEALKKFIKQYGKRWSVISRLMGGTRTGKQIRDRYLNKLDPTIHEKEWTPQEDELLIKYWKQLGNKWAEIAKHLDGRTESMVKNRYYSYISRKRIGPQGEVIPDDTTLSMESSDLSGGQMAPVVRGRQSNPMMMQLENTQLYYQQQQQQPVYPQQYIPNQQMQGTPFQTYNSNGQANFTPNGTIFQSENENLNFANNRSTENAYGSYGRVPLLPGVDVATRNSFDSTYAANRRSDSFLPMDRFMSNRSFLREELQRSLGNSGKSNDSRALELLNLYNNYHPGRISEEDARSVQLPTTDPYGYVDQFGGRKSRDQRSEWQQQGVQAEQSNQHSMYDENVMQKFGPRRDDEMSMSSNVNNDMDIEGQLEKLAVMLDSKTVSYHSKNSGSLSDIPTNGEEAQKAIEKAHKMAILKKRQEALQLLLAKTQYEMQTADPLLSSPFASLKGTDMMSSLKMT